jgi:cell division protein FtsZ
MPELTELTPRITVIGVGGAGGNAVNNMIRADLPGVDFVVTNTDAQALLHSEAQKKVQLGAQLTQGLGAGARPDVGRAAAEESLEQINEHLTGSHMVFVTAGMGGGTGTGAAPIIARLAREQGILTVGVVTKPFQFEGSRRMRLAEEGIQELQEYVDTLIIIPNQNLFRIANEKTTFADAFSMADEVLHSGVRGVTDLMVMPGLVNLDFADVRTVMSEMGKAMMGTGEAEGENRALEAAEAAISNPLLDEVSMKGARGVLINITGGMDLTLFEVDEAANRIRNEVDPDANILVGSALDESLNGRMRVSVVATGIEAEAVERVISVQTTAATAQAQPAAQPAPAQSAPVQSAQAPAEAPVQREVAEEVAEPEQAPAAETVAEETVSMQEDMVKEDVAEVREPALESAAFIASEPMEPEAPVAEATGTPDPFAEAAISNGSRPAASQRVEGRSWFERVTGVGRNRREQGQNVSELFEQEPTAANPKAEAPRPAVQEKPAPSLGRVTTEDRIAPKRKLDDQLEIPTFLRRQAN